MKKLILFSLLISSFAVFSKTQSLNKFSEVLSQNINTVLDNNPQIYEKDMPNVRQRGPASVIEPAPLPKEKIDKNLGLKTW